MSKVYNVLFLCTGNSARSILAESILNYIGQGKFNAFSAGSFPTGKVNPFAINILKSKGYLTNNLRSKSWDEFSKPDSPTFDFIFTVCDNAKNEVCPVWLGHPMTIHWGISDPASAISDEEKTEAFSKTFDILSYRLELLNQLDIAFLTPDELKLALTQIAS